MTAPPTTAVRMNLRTPQMEALYEAAFLRIFTAWEVALADVTARMMARAGTPTWAAQAPSGKHLYSTLRESNIALFAGRDYLLWHNPATVVKRVGNVLLASPLEACISGEKTWLENIGNVRHRIAHSSTDAAQKFESAALALTGTTYRGSPGRLLRGQDISDPLNPTRWISRFDSKLRDLMGIIVS